MFVTKVTFHILFPVCKYMYHIPSYFHGPKFSRFDLKTKKSYVSDFKFSRYVLRVDTIQLLSNISQIKFSQNIITGKITCYTI